MHKILIRRSKFDIPNPARYNSLRLLADIKAMLNVCGEVAESIDTYSEFFDEEETSSKLLGIMAMLDRAGADLDKLLDILFSETEPLPEE
jgi:hypothetical protein